MNTRTLATRDATTSPLIREAGVLLTQAIVALGKQERTAVTS